ncbi:hypothetical protein Cgig2_017740 [Carnegiea gigantea]|uniref:Uncharacterized protein n=1 Tax=Carnegiea gigantea TaxID=171969 RepID=A0A9Q1GNG1_9CARY|nr:hypothetical protein Cgig2_017740 [Carnegiea gigantea]
MVGMHPGCFGNWALVTDDPWATVHSCTGVLPMTFSGSFDIKAIAEYDRRGVAFPPLPLPKDFQAPCTSFELAVAMEAAELKGLGSCKDERFSLWSQPSLSSVGASSSRGSGCMVTGFWKLDSIQRPDQGRVREPVDRKRARRWSRRMRAWPLRGCPPLRIVTSRGSWEFLPISSSPYPFSINTTPYSFIGCSGIHLPRGNGIKHKESDRNTHFPLEMADHVRESFVWRWKRASRLPRPLPKDFHALCPRFLLPEVEGAAVDFELPEIV